MAIFLIQDGDQITKADLPSMIKANQDDGELCDWLKSAQIGESFLAIISVTRIA